MEPDSAMRIASRSLLDGLTENITDPSLASMLRGLHDANTSILLESIIMLYACQRALTMTADHIDQVAVALDPAGQLEALEAKVYRLTGLVTQLTAHIAQLAEAPYQPPDAQ